jgi:hypothetical protein
MLQREANLVLCDARVAVSLGSTGPNKLIVEQLETEVNNRSNHVITDLVCQVPFAGIDSWISMREALGPGEPPARQILQAIKPFEANTDFREIRASAKFEFSLDGVAWSKRYGEPAQRLP